MRWCYPIAGRLAEKALELTGSDPSKIFLGLIETVTQWLDDVRNNAGEFQHISQILCIKDRFEQDPVQQWLSGFRISDMKTKDHDVRNYVDGIEKQNTHFRIEHVKVPRL